MKKEEEKETGLCIKVTGLQPHSEGPSGALSSAVILSQTEPTASSTQGGRHPVSSQLLT
jgi:hypothetical protein